MQFISLDIAYMPNNNDGFKYMLLIGDMFSKYIQGIPLRDQSASSIVRAFECGWLYIHGNPLYVLSDQGSNVDGDTMRTFCSTFGIEKRRSSAYHSAGNGFAERNIRSVREMLRAVLLEQNLAQNKWRKLLPGLIFALHCSKSKATKCVPYNIVFGRSPTLPIDILFDSQNTPKNKDAVAPNMYSEEVAFSLRCLWDVVTSHLKISKNEMLKQYNRNLRFNDYQVGQKVWLKTKFVKAVENKLAPKRSGPWIVLRKLPNGVNFQIKNEKNNSTKIVHHNRLKAVNDNTVEGSIFEGNDKKSLMEEIISEDSTTNMSDDESDYSPSDSDVSDHDVIEDRRYPIRQRVQREIPGAIPWDAIQL